MWEPRGITKPDVFTTHSLENFANLRSSETGATLETIKSWRSIDIPNANNNRMTGNNVDGILWLPPIFAHKMGQKEALG